MIFLGYEHGFQCVQSTLLLFVGDKDAPLFAVKRPVYAGYCTKLEYQDIHDYSNDIILIIINRLSFFKVINQTRKYAFTFHPHV